jgi:hypothetical protein
MKVHCNLLSDQIGANKVLIDTTTYQIDKTYEFDIDYTVLKQKIIQFDLSGDMSPDDDFEIVLRLEY